MIGFRLLNTIACCALLTACAESPDGTTPNLARDIGTLTGSTAGLSSQQKALRDQERAYARSRAQATAAGALIGGLGCWAAGGEAAEIAACAAAGGAAGYVGSTYLTRDHQNFTASRDSLQADIAAAQADTARMEENVQVARQAVQYQRQEIGQVNAAYRAGQATSEQYTRELNQVAGDIQSVRNMRQQGEARVTSLQQSINAYGAAGLPTGELVQLRNAQRQRVSQLRQIENQMVGVIAATPSGVDRPSV